MGGLAELERRVDELESRVAIAALAAEYCHGCDHFDLERFGAIWHEDGEFPVGEPFGEPVGPEQIKAVLARMRERYPQIRHWSANLVLRFEGADAAAGESDALCEAIDNRERHLLISASYADRFERRAGVWKIARREIALNHARVITSPPPRA